MSAELAKLRRAVEVAEMIQTGLRNAILQRQLYATSLEGAASTYEERYCVEIAAQQVQLARAAYEAAKLRLRASTDCSKSGHDLAPDRPSASPAGDSSP